MHSLSGCILQSTFGGRSVKISNTDASTRAGRAAVRMNAETVTRCGKLRSDRAPPAVAGAIPEIAHFCQIRPVTYQRFNCIAFITRQGFSQSAGASRPCHPQGRSQCVLCDAEYPFRCHCPPHLLCNKKCMDSLTQPSAIGIIFSSFLFAIFFNSISFSFITS